MRSHGITTAAAVYECQYHADSALPTAMAMRDAQNNAASCYFQTQTHVHELLLAVYRQCQHDEAFGFDCSDDADNAVLEVGVRSARGLGGDSIRCTAMSIRVHCDWVAMGGHVEPSAFRASRSYRAPLLMHATVTHRCALLLLSSAPPDSLANARIDGAVN